MPIAWSELDRDVREAYFNWRNVPAWVSKRKVDPWADYAETRQGLPRASRSALAKG